MGKVTTTLPDSFFDGIDGFKDFEFMAPSGTDVPLEVREMYKLINEEVYQDELPKTDEGLVVNPELSEQGATAAFVRRDGLDQFWFEFSEERKIFELPSSLVHEMAHLLNHLVQWKDIEAGESLKGHDDGFRRIAEATGLPIDDLSAWPDPENKQYLEWVAHIMETVRSRMDVAQEVLDGRNVRSILQVCGF